MYPKIICESSFIVPMKNPHDDVTVIAQVFVLLKMVWI